jgi:hypothetical protein
MFFSKKAVCSAVSGLSSARAARTRPMLQRMRREEYLME